jgi:hypothetical protein
MAPLNPIHQDFLHPEYAVSLNFEPNPAVAGFNSIPQDDWKDLSDDQPRERTTRKLAGDFVEVAKLTLEIGQTLYRFDAFRKQGYHSCVELILTEFLVEKVTPAGGWVTRIGGFYPKPKFVLASGRKRLAYPTREEAWESFAARTRRRHAILHEQLNLAKSALKAANGPMPQQPKTSPPVFYYS